MATKTCAAQILPGVTEERPESMMVPWFPWLPEKALSHFTPRVKTSISSVVMVRGKKRVSARELRFSKMLF